VAVSKLLSPQQNESSILFMIVIPLENFMKECRCSQPIHPSFLVIRFKIENLRFRCGPNEISLFFYDLPKLDKKEQIIPVDVVKSDKRVNSSLTSETDCKLERMSLPVKLTVFCAFRLFVSDNYRLEPFCFLPFVLSFISNYKIRIQDKNVT
jgi:hypothetical protein